MFTHITSNWSLFCILFGGMLLLTFIMRLQSVHFYTRDVVVRKFSIMELELPSTPKELANLVKGLYRLPEEQSMQAVRALKSQLYTDFLFMPFAYGTVLLFCLHAARKMNTSIGTGLFIILAFLQLLAWLLDIIENIYLLGKIKPAAEESVPAVHKAYLIMECCKWGIALGSTICAVAAFFYFWLIGNYNFGSLIYPLILFGEIILFVLAGKFFVKKQLAI